MYFQDIKHKSESLIFWLQYVQCGQNTDIGKEWFVFLQMTEIALLFLMGTNIDAVSCYAYIFAPKYAVTNAFEINRWTIIKMSPEYGYAWYCNLSYTYSLYCVSYHVIKKLKSN